jgi:uncharacterized membrane protein HdeD (DUF308 family)
MHDGFLVGVVATTSVIAGFFFLKFRKNTRASLFLAFGASFLIEGLNRCAGLFLQKPNEGSPWIYLVRLLSMVLILIAILRTSGNADIAAWRLSEQECGRQSCLRPHRSRIRTLWVARSRVV